jgi:hypothetical protein
MTASSVDSVLSYASSSTPTAPRRTTLRIIFSIIGEVLKTVLLVLRLCILGTGYAIFATAVTLRFLLILVAKTMLFLGRLRWHAIQRRALSMATWVDAKVLRFVDGVLGRFILRRTVTPQLAYPVGQQ